MAATHVINVDLAEVFEASDKKKFIRTLGWGDEVEVVKVTTQHVEIKTTKFVEQEDGSFKPVAISGFIKPSKTSKIKPDSVVVKKEDDRVLRVNFVDVQQGDGSVIETAKGKIILIDGGDNQLFARYLAARFRDTSAAQPKEIDCIVVTHGDADHFAGLTEIHDSETQKGLPGFKRLFIHPRRVFHNGLVKRPSTRNGKDVPDVELLGATQKVSEKTVLITELAGNLLEVPATEMNAPFKAWRKALQTYQERGNINIRRLEKGDNDAFDFLADEEIKVEVLGPILTKSGSVKGLKFLGTPKAGPRIGHESVELTEEGFSGLSASHTINGHSIVLRLSYGKFQFLFAGDLNDQSERILTRAHKDGTLNLRAEVLKVPHHGSADFSGAFMEAVAPVISVISSGDESERKEFIHPRATLLGSLGKFSRVAEPLIFVTELVAFFKVEGPVNIESNKKKRSFFAFSRAAFGIVKMRTDGERLLVYTNSGQADLKEAYAYQMNAAGEPEPVEVRKV